MTSTPKNNFSFLKKIPKEIGIQTPEKFDPHYKEITRLKLKLTETESQIETIKHNLQNKRIFSQSPDKYKSKSYKILNDPISSNDVDKSKSPLSNMGKQIMKIDNRSYRYSPTF